MKADDLFDPVKEEDIFGFETVKFTKLKSDFIDKVAKSPQVDVDELELAKALLSVLRDDFVSYGTDGGDMRLDDQTVKTVLRAAKIVTKRNNLAEPILPFRDFQDLEIIGEKKACQAVGAGLYVVASYRIFLIPSLTQSKKDKTRYILRNFLHQ